MSFTTKEKMLLALFSDVDKYLTDEVLRRKLLSIANDMVSKSENKKKQGSKLKKKIS